MPSRFQCFSFQFNGFWLHSIKYTVEPEWNHDEPIDHVIVSNALIMRKYKYDNSKYKNY